MKQTLHFHYDPIWLTKHLIQRYVEQKIEGNTFKARQFALYDYLHTFTDEECEEILHAYVKQENLTEITYAKWEDDCRIMLELIEQTERFNKLLEKQRLALVTRYEFEEGKGISGVLTPSGLFIQCGHQEHSIITQEMDWKDQILSIYFSSPLRFGKDTFDSGVITMSPFRENESPPNEKQSEWIDAHTQYLDAGQHDFIDYIYRNRPEKE